MVCNDRLWNISGRPSNKINKTSTEVQLKIKSSSSEAKRRASGQGPLRGSSTRDSETNRDMVKVRLILAGLVLAFFMHRLFFWKCSTMNMATPIARSHAFLPSKVITDSAVLKIKPTIEPMRPGRIPARSYLQESYDHFQLLWQQTSGFLSMCSQSLQSLFRLPGQQLRLWNSINWNFSYSLS